MRKDTKLIPIKSMEVGKEFHHLQSPNSSRMAKFEVVEVCGAFAKIKVYDKIETFSTEGLFAEVPLSEAEFKAKYKQEAAVVVEQLKNKMSIHDHIGHHEMWNSWIQTDPYEFAAACAEHKIRIVGWFELGDEAREFVSGMTLDIGIVAEYEDDNYRFWCHARKDWIDSIMEEWEED